MSLVKIGPGESHDCPTCSETFAYTPHPDAATRGPVDKFGQPWPTYYNHHVEKNADGSGGNIIFTGRVSGSVVLSNGKKYNVTPAVIEHDDGDAGLIGHHIAMIHEDLGTLNVPASKEVPDGYVYKHVCDESCGEEATASVATAADPTT
jgi:hypothetical protein